MVKQEARNNLAKNNWSKAVAITIFYLTLITSTTLLSQLIQETLKIDLNGKFTSFFSEFLDISINQGVLINSFKNAGTTNITFNFCCFISTFFGFFKILFLRFKRGIAICFRNILLFYREKTFFTCFKFWN